MVGINATLYNDSEMALKISESYDGGGAVFAKIDGVGVTLQEMNDSIKNIEADKEKSNGQKANEAIEISEEYLNCLQDVNSTENCSDLLDDNDSVYLAENEVTLKMLVSMLESLSGVDGKWIKMPTNDPELANMLGMVNIEGINGQCAVDLVNDLRDNRNWLAEAYDNNPFVVSAVVDTESDELSEVEEEIMTAMVNADGEDEEGYEEEEGAANQKLIYQVFFDDEQVVGFAKELEDLPSVKSLGSCLGQKDAEIDSDELVEAVHNLPTFYVSLDEELNFAQVYFALTPGDGSTMIVGMDLTYPDDVTVTQPNQYEDWSNITQRNL